MCLPPPLSLCLLSRIAPSRWWRREEAERKQFTLREVAGNIRIEVVRNPPPPNTHTHTLFPTWLVLTNSGRHHGIKQHFLISHFNSIIGGGEKKEAKPTEFQQKYF